MNQPKTPQNSSISEGVSPNHVPNSSPPSNKNTRGISILLIALILLLIVIGCIFGWMVFNRLDTSQATQTPGGIATATSLASDITPTDQPLPCNWAAFIDDVTIPDDTTMNGGEKFTKTWRLKNIGSCAWNAEYALVFSSGDNLSGPAEQALGAAVDVGQTIDISVELTAPTETGSYIGNYKLRSNDDIVFGLGNKQDQPFWVSISVDQKSTVEIKGTDDPCGIFTWTSGIGEMECPVEDEMNGSVMLIEDPILEGNIQENEKGIAVQPNDGQSGFVLGSTNPISIQSGDRFKAVIGCMDQSAACDVTFEVNYKTSDGSEGNLGAWRQISDGSIDKLDIDLSDLAGQTITLELNVKSNNNTSLENWGIWLEPRLIRYE